MMIHEEIEDLTCGEFAGMTDKELKEEFVDQYMHLFRCILRGVNKVNKMDEIYDRFLLIRVGRELGRRGYLMMADKASQSVN